MRDQDPFQSLTIMSFCVSSYNREVEQQERESRQQERERQQECYKTIEFSFKTQ